MTLGRPFRSNCAMWALGQWLRQSGYVLFHKSKYGWWLHYLWSPDLEHFYEFVPADIERLRRRAQRWKLPPLWFTGEVRPLARTRRHVTRPVPVDRRQAAATDFPFYPIIPGHV